MTRRSGAQMAELVDAPASGAGARKGVEVRVLFWAPSTLSALIAEVAKCGSKQRHEAIFYSLPLVDMRARFRPICGGFVDLGEDCIPQSMAKSR